jgi:hypothetical protein
MEVDIYPLLLFSLFYTNSGVFEGFVKFCQIKANYANAWRLKWKHERSLRKFNRPKEMKMKNMFKARPFWTVLIVAINMAFVITACSGVATPTAKATATAPAATLTPKPTATRPGGFPVGTYKPDHVLWTQYILFNAQGTVVLGLGDADTGSYTVSGDQIVFNMDVGICHNHPGTYHWEIHGNTLLLKPVNETCTDSDRAADLGGRSWSLQP